MHRLISKLKKSKNLREFGEEFEQSVIRLFAVAIMLTYTAVMWTLYDIDRSIVQMYMAYIPLSFIFIAWSYYDRNLNSLRIILAMVLGVISTTYALVMANEESTPLLIIYFWLILSTGLRQGSKYLVINTAICLVGFGTVIFMNPFWSHMPYISSTVLLAMIILTIYIYVLQNRLRTAVLEAEKANMAKSQFLANMSHEIRTPLNGVIGMSDMLTATKLNAEQKDFVSTIQSSAKTLLSLIEDVLDISKIEAGKIELDNRNFDLYGTLKSIYNMMNPISMKKGLICNLHISPDIPYKLIGDELHLRQVLINLIGNAIKFTESGNIDINVHIVEKKDENVQLRFEITDTGIGISKDIQDRIFDKFTQADKHISLKYGGTGLGTAIASNLVKLMGGEIGVISEPEVGSTFWFELTFSQEKKVELPDTELSHNSNILLVATQGDKHHALIKLLNEWKFEWDYISSAKEINEYMESEKSGSSSKIILVDYDNLDVDAFSFPDRINSEVKSSTTLVLLKDHPHSTKDETNLLKSGYFCILNTPIEKRLLFNILHATTLDSSEQDNVTKLVDLQPKPTSRTSLKIIVGEDNPTNQKVIQKILEHSGHKVDVFDNGQQVLKAVNEKPYDLMLLDMYMPVMDGIETVKIYRFMTTSENRIPIIMLTANATKEAVNLSKEAGVDTYLTKPVETRKLLNAIYALVDKNQRDRPETISIPDLKPENISSPDSILDLNTLNNIASLSQDFDFMDDLIHGFLKDTKEQIDKLIYSIESKNYQNAQDIAHTMKGSTKSIGATAMAECVTNIYNLSASDRKESIPPHLQSLIDEYDRTRTALLNYLKQLASAAL